MKKIFTACLLFSFFFLFPSWAKGEEIDDFAARIIINKDGSITVSERIEYDFGNLSRHGIFRTIPTIKINQQGKKFRLEFSEILVADATGVPYQFTQTTEDNALKLKIGDPDKTVTGLHTYVIQYRVSGTLTYFSDHDELYWNVTGNEWKVPIRDAHVAVMLPTSLPSSKTKIACFTGVIGSQKQNCLWSYTNGMANAATTAGLSSFGGLTIVVGFPKNIVAIHEPKEVVSFSNTPLGKVATVVFALVLVIGGIPWYLVYPIWLIVKWYRYGQDPKVSVGQVTAWFDPPKAKDLRPLTPAETGALIDEQADMRDILATIVDLARRGYLIITEKEKDDFYLEKTKDVSQDNSFQPFEKNFFEGIFRNGLSTRLKGADLTATVEETKQSIYHSLVKEGFFPENPESVRKFYRLIAIIAVFTLNIPLFFIALIFGRNLPRKTSVGVQKAVIARSLRNFLSSQERQLEFQAKNQLFFEKLLPYAIAFGVENIWAKRFEDITMQPPNWYLGYSYGTFTSSSFINSLDSSFSGFIQATTPTSSTSGFSSGFSGGSSGGGGGGGGGGSW